MVSFRIRSERKKVPILVGGSMLYISSITDALSLAPHGDSDLRARLIAEYDADQGAGLYRRLQKIDPDAAASIHPNNKPRVVRAVEIYEILRKPKSKSISAKKELRPRDEQKISSSDMIILGVSRLRGELIKRIDERTEQMVADGWIDEVRGLIQMGYTADDPGMKSHGYREIMQYLSELESQSDSDLESMQEALKDRIKSKTRQYAKRQLSWWRGDNRIRWV